ncbi:hypothetical protein KC356_g8024 [Hortaea werneckii]|nr:hypothetical protein KC356_g8024 [Hortaea werneckii]
MSPMYKAWPGTRDTIRPSNSLPMPTTDLTSSFRQTVPCPTATTTAADFIRQLEEKKHDWAEVARRSLPRDNRARDIKGRFPYRPRDRRDGVGSRPQTQPTTTNLRNQPADTPAEPRRLPYRRQRDPPTQLDPSRSVVKSPSAGPKPLRPFLWRQIAANGVDEEDSDDEQDVLWGDNAVPIRAHRNYVAAKPSAWRPKGCDKTNERTPKKKASLGDAHVGQVTREPKPMRVGPQPKSMEHKGAFGVTIYGTAEVAAELDALVREFPRLFADDGKLADLPEEDWMPISLDWEVVDVVYDKLHEQGKLEWVKPPTPFGFPVFINKKEVKGETKKRPVVDIRGLNTITITDAYPMLLQSDVTSAVAGCFFISVMDMVAFLYQWPVAAADRHKLVAVSHRRQEHYNVATMGYKNSSPRSLDDHIAHLPRVFSEFQEMNLTMSAKKTFGFPSIELLGQDVDGMGLSTSQEKLDAIAKDVEHYLGLTGWRRSYIPYYAALCEPLQACKKRIFKSAPASAHARKSFAGTSLVGPPDDLRKYFQALQSAFARPSMLHHFDRARPLYIHVDASK